MAELGQGLVLMLAGMGIVYVFLCVLIVVTKTACKGIARFDYIFPKDAPKKTPAKAVGSEDEQIALALAVALKGM